MGDRAVVVFKNTETEDVSPTVHLQWGGMALPRLIEELNDDAMEDRRGNVSVACARFVWRVHMEMSPEVASIRVSNTEPDCIAAIRNGDAEAMAKFSPSDAGFVVVDADTFEWQAYGGYLEHGSYEMYLISCTQRNKREAAEIASDLDRDAT